jgi:Tol biopolymer transport system component
VINDVNDHRIVSLTKDGRTLVSVAGAVSSSAWTLPLRGPGKPTRVSRSAMDGLRGVTFTREGKLLYTSYVGGIWSLWVATADGAERNSFLTMRPQETIQSPQVAEDGSVYHVVRTRTGAEFRVVAKDGTSTHVIAADVAFDSIGVSPDGKTVVFSAFVGGSPHVFSMPTGKGTRKQLLDSPAFSPAMHPSGHRVAFYFVNSDAQQRLGVASIDGGPLLADLPAEGRTPNSRLALTDDGIYLNTMSGDYSNVWLQPIDGRPARRITSFEDDLVFDFAVSRDGGTLAVARGPRLRDAQVVTGFENSASGGAR